MLSIIWILSRKSLFSLVIALSCSPWIKTTRRSFLSSRSRILREGVVLLMSCPFLFGSKKSSHDILLANLHFKLDHQNNYGQQNAKCRLECKH